MGMPIVHKQWKVVIEDKAPYDGLGFLDVFAGEFILPIAPKLRRFWCSRYWDETGKHILFRFETENYDNVKLSIEVVQKMFGTELSRKKPMTMWGTLVMAKRSGLWEVIRGKRIRRSGLISFMISLQRQRGCIWGVWSRMRMDIGGWKRTRIAA